MATFKCQGNDRDTVGPRVCTADIAAVGPGDARAAQYAMLAPGTGVGQKEISGPSVICLGSVQPQPNIGGGGVSAASDIGLYVLTRARGQAHELTPGILCEMASTGRLSESYPRPTHPKFCIPQRGGA